MGILHHLGLRDAHKGFFKEISIEDAMNHLTELGKDEYTPFIVAFKRYAAGTYDLYSENSLEMFVANDKFKKMSAPPYADFIIAIDIVINRMCSAGLCLEFSWVFL